LVARLEHLTGFYSKGRLQALPANNRLVRNSRPVVNTLAFYNVATITGVKCIDITGPWDSIHNN